MKSKLIIRKMDIIDIDGVIEVETLSFAEPWPKEIFYQEIKNNDFAYYFVAQLDNQIIGYAGLWSVIDDAQITNIAILPEYRGKKIGEKLFEYTCQQAMRIGVKRLSLEVRVSNIRAQNLYRKFGFVPGGIRKNYYTDNQEDAIVMWVNLK